ncbi:hypothetical protein DL98DRAFT_511712 [Cadophora sp. DSE1049]|nr:hypothetical protein DL98DRAFT_511712 [Cadophora sp. DSE1049]
MTPRPLPPSHTIPVIPPSLHHHSITPTEWFTTHPRLTRLCVGALIFRYHTNSDPLTQTQTIIPQILLIKRASTDFFPNLWEVPGGSVESTDPTLLHAVVREGWEETGLLVKEFKAQVWDLRVGEKRMVVEDDGIEKMVVVGERPGEGEVEFFGGKGEVWCKLNFVVDVGVVGDGEVMLDEEEHQDWGWFGREDIFGDGEKGKEFISEQAVRIVERGFEVFDGSER